MFTNQEPSDARKALFESDEALRKLYETLDDTLQADPSQPGVLDFLNPTAGDPNAEAPSTWEELEAELDHTRTPPANFVISDRLQQAVDHWDETLTRLAATNQAPMVGNLISELLNWEETIPEAETELNRLQHQVEDCLLGDTTSASLSQSAGSNLSSTQRQQALIFFLTHVQVEVESRETVESPAPESEPDLAAKPLRTVTLPGVDGMPKTLEMEVTSQEALEFGVSSIKESQAYPAWLEISGNFQAAGVLQNTNKADVEVHVLYAMYDAFSKELIQQGSAVAGQVHVSDQGQVDLKIYVPQPKTEGEFEFELECFAIPSLGPRILQFPLAQFPLAQMPKSENALALGDERASSSMVKWDCKKDRVKDVCLSKEKPRISWLKKKPSGN